MAILTTISTAIRGIINPIFGGASSTNFVDVYQDRCNLLTNTDEDWLMIDNAFSKNFIVRIIPVTGVDKTKIKLLLPLASTSNYGSRVIVFNHDEIEVTIEGSRQTNINKNRSVKTSAPYFQIINVKEDPESIYANFILSTSASI
ncbi:MAG: hypothetical protein COA84_14280 [Robiginitomaculum sp.]|nr:MAG: hypothetical protein COA84_14280 [Robiginitomaculum sp.]